MSETTPTLETSVKSVLLQQKRSLSVTPAMLEYNGKIFSKFEITEIRYGVRGIGYYFNFGRIYHIDIRSITQEKISIQLDSYFGFRKKKVHDEFQQILTTIFAMFFNDKIQDFIRQLFNNEIFKFADVDFLRTGVKLKFGNPIIPWLEIETRRYRTYVAVFSKIDKGNYRHFNYAEDWNTEPLMQILSLIPEIIKRKNA
jgi:hypothetical protein